MADSDEDDDTFVAIGTALPEYEEDDTAKQKPVPLHEQKVVDEKGRQRFHGAFTGGFSAGYFNTVGSKEGFTPSTFKSSREKKDGPRSQVPEDFMDTEDVGEFGIAPRRVAPTKHYAPQSSSSSHKPASSSIIPGMDLLQELVVPKNLPIGVELLRGLGWKDGQGIGPRVQKRKKKKKTPRAPAQPSGEKVYGCARPPTESESSEEDYMPANVTFAPKDVTPVNFKPKSNVHGLGYSGIQHAGSHGGGVATAFSLFEPPPLGGRMNHSNTSRGGMSRTGRKGITGSAFGVGAFEDDEDMDVYGVDSMSKYNRVLDEPDTDHNHGWTAPKHHSGSMKAVTGPSANNTLPGFALAAGSTSTPTIYPPPQLPRHFRPKHQHRVTTGGGDKYDTAGKRGEALGEQPEIKSVFDLISREDQEKLTVIRSDKPMMALRDIHRAKKREQILKEQQEEKEREQDPKQKEKEEEKKRAIQAALSAAKTPLPESGSTLFKVGTSFQPFASNPAKQERYEAYVQAKKDGNTNASGDGVTEWEAAQEREEFERAAHMYRPLTSLMASRFTRAQFNDDVKKDDPEAAQMGLPKKSAIEEAAESKQYGRLTREIFEWHPDKIVCKRFNLPNPYPDSDIVGVPRVKRDKFSVFSLLGLTTPTQKQYQQEEEERRKQQQEREEKEKKESSDTRRGRRGGTNQIKPLAILGTRDLRPVPKPPTSDTTATSSSSTTSITVSSSETTTASSSTALGAINLAIATGGNTASSTAATTTSSSEPLLLSNEAPAEQEEGISDRPPMDLFKAIFADSSSSSSSESEKEEEDTAMQQKKEEIVQEEAVMSRLAPPPQPPNPPSLSTSSLSHNNGHNDDGELYGPAPPPPPPSSSSSFYPPNKEKKKKKKKEKKHKHKKSSKHKKCKKKKKEKKKKKKKRARTPSSSDDSSSDSDMSEADDDDSNDSDKDDKEDDKQIDDGELLSKLKKSLTKAKRPTAADFWK